MINDDDDDEDDDNDDDDASSSSLKIFVPCAKPKSGSAATPPAPSWNRHCRHMNLYSPPARTTYH